MISAKEIFDWLNETAPFDTQMGFDNAGLLIGSGQQTSEIVYVALDAAKAVLQEAARAGAGIVVTHHPIIFHPLKSLLADSNAYLAANWGITVISAHTNLDKAVGGVNDTLTEKIGVKISRRLDEDCACVGELTEKTDCHTFAESIRRKLSLSGLRYSDTSRKICRVLVSCGAGGSNVYLAKECGADAIVCGEIRHHEILFAKDNDIAVFDLGHYGSEHIIVPALTKRLQERFPDTVFRAAQSDTDGMRYLAELS